jgi:putative endonuclease
LSRQERQKAWRRGWLAESLCALILRLSGYRILHRRLRTPVGEIDILARRADVLAVIEVKARGNFASAAESVTEHQKRRLVRAAGWVVAGRSDLAVLQLRFDVMLVAPWRLPKHVVDAWRGDAQWLQSGREISW